MTATGGPRVAARGTVRPPRRRYPRRSIWAALVLVLVSAGCGSTAPASVPGTGSTGAPSAATALDASTTAKLQMALDGTRAQGGFPGVIAGVWTANDTWIGTSGTTGQGKNAVPTPADHVRIGSLTKTVTATGCRISRPGSSAPIKSGVSASPAQSAVIRTGLRRSMLPRTISPVPKCSPS